MKIFRISDFIMIGSWLAAFILSLPVIEPFEFSRLGALVFMSVFAVTGLGRELAGPGMILPRSVLFWTLPALLALAFASLFWTPSLMDTFIAASTLSLAVLGFVVFATARGIFRVQIPLVPLIFLTLIVLSLWGIVQFLFLPAMLVNGGVRHPFGNPNNYAALLMLGFFPALGWMLCAIKPKAVIAAAVTSVILIAGIMLIGGRAISFLTIIGIVAMFVLARPRVHTRGRLFAMVVAAGLLFACLQFVFPDRADPAITRTGQLFDATGDEAVSSRIALWKSTFEMIGDYPILGTGYGTYALFYPEYRGIGDSGSAGLMAHNDLLQGWAELGIPGLVLLLALFIGSLMRMARVMALRDANSGERTLALALFLGAGLLVCASMVDFHLYISPILCLLGPVFGLWFRYTGLVLNERTRAGALPAAAPAALGWALVAVPLLVMLIVAQGFLRSSYDIRNAQTAAFQGDFQRMQELVASSDKAAFGLNARSYLIGAAMRVGMLQGDTGMTDAARQPLAENINALLDRSQALNPRLTATYLYRSIVALEAPKQDVETARAALDHALSIDPQNIAARMTMADLQYQQGDKQAALDTLKQGLDLRYFIHDPQNYYAMTASIALEQGDKATEARAMRQLGRWKDRQMKGKGTLVPDPSAGSMIMRKD